MIYKEPVSFSTDFYFFHTIAQTESIRNMTDPCKTRTLPRLYASACRFFLMVLILFLVFSPLNSEARPPEKSTLGIGFGTAGILDHHKIVLGSLEYRPSFEYLNVRPWVGTDFGYQLFYVAGGILTHLHLTGNYFLTPSFGIGFYSSNKGIELGSHLEFRSGIELRYVFPDKNALAFHFGHVSNGSLGEKNPGSEILKVIYYFPL